MPEIGFREPWIVRDESSGWSNTQTITITYDSASTSPSQTATPPLDPTSTSNSNQTPSIDFTPPTNILLGIITLLLCIIIALGILFLRKQQKH